MKGFTKFFVLTALVAIFAVGAFAQSQATEQGTANATIVDAIALSETTQLNFGSNVPPAGADATVTVAPNGGLTDNSGVNLGGTAAGIWAVNGAENRLFIVTVPTGTITLGTGAPGVTLTVQNFQSDCGGDGCQLSSAAAGATDTVRVGADLIIPAAAASGTYAGNYDVTVAYN